MQRLSVFALILFVNLAATNAEPANSPSPSNGTSPAQFEMTGHGFVVQPLRNKTIAFRGRPYVWSDLQAGLDGLRYTQVAGGVPAKIHLKVNATGMIFLAVAANNMLELKEQGWTLPIPDRSNTFCYTDPNRTLMVVLSRVVSGGQEFDLPQLGWSGCVLLLAPGA